MIIAGTRKVKSNILHFIVIFLSITGSLGADVLQLGDEKFEDVYVTQSDSTFYIFDPEANLITSRRKTQLDDAILLESPIEERALLKQKLEKFLEEQKKNREEKNSKAESERLKVLQDEQKLRDLEAKRAEEWRREQAQIEKERQAEEARTVNPIDKQPATVPPPAPIPDRDIPTGRDLLGGLTPEQYLIKKWPTKTVYPRRKC